jgi:hypothetical protein
MSRSVRLACSVAVSAVLAAAAAGDARAADPPDLVGTWKGTAHAVHVGSNPYRVAEKPGPNFPENAIEFTYAITEQHGNRFAGTATGGRFTETLIGALSPDNRSGFFLDEDGEYTFTVRDADTLDACYRHTFTTSRVAGCWELRRAAD